VVPELKKKKGQERRKGIDKAENGRRRYDSRKRFPHSSLSQKQKKGLNREGGKKGGKSREG